MSGGAAWGTDVLAGATVVDVSSGIAGAYCSKVLADAGACVYKVEDPSGDPLRRRSPTPSPAPAAGSTLFRFLGQSKLGVVVDPGSDQDHRELARLLSIADVVVWSPGPATGAFDHLRPREILAAHPRAIVCAITPFGLDGPWAGRPATDLTIQAWAGGVGHRGEPGLTPVHAGGQITEWAAGVVAVVAVLTSRHRTLRQGGGELLDVSMLESAASVCAMCYPVTFESMAGRPLREGRMINVPGVHRANDGWGGFMVLTGQQWLDFCALVGRPDWIEDESLLLVDNRAQRRSELAAWIDEWMAERSLAQVLEMAAAFRVPAAALGNGKVTPLFEQVREQGMLEVGPDGFAQPVPPFRFTRGSARRAARAAPSLRSSSDAGPRAPTSGEPDAERLGNAAMTEPHGPARPFDGLRVADLTAFWAGTTPGRFMAMMGADVIRVESADSLDGFRFASTRSFDEELWWEWAPMVDSCNVGKRHLGLDLSSSDGQAVLLRLVEHCDVLIENYTPRVLEAWGLDHDRLLEANPELVVVRMPAFGLAGPWRDWPGYAQTMEMFSGMASVTGFPDGPAMLPNGQVDPIGGYQALAALLLGLEERRRTGHGMLVECPLLASAINVAAEQIAHFAATGELVERMGNRDPMIAPQGVYRCLDAERGTVRDRWVALSVPDDEVWAALRAVLGSPAWTADPVLMGGSGRWAAHDEIDRELSAWCATRSGDAIVSALWDRGVPVAKVLMPHQQREAVQLDARRFFEDVTHPVTGTHPQATFPARFTSVVGPWILRPNPTVGQHNREILGELVGIPPDEITRLEQTGVLGTRPRRNRD